MENVVKIMDATSLAEDNYSEYSRYVLTRAFPNLIDGCKDVERRCIHACYEGLPRKRIKSATAVGEIVKLHPHPNSIYGVLVSMASKFDCPFPLYDTKGNFGGLGHPAAAERYTELMLSDLAIEMYEKFGKYVDLVQSELDTLEPENLAALLPLCFIHGTYGIPVGMSTVNIPALLPEDLIKYYMEILKAKDLDKQPKVTVRPNIGDLVISISEKDWMKILDNGQGSVRVSPDMEISKDRKTITITGLPKNRSSETIKDALADEIAKGQVDFRNESTDSYLFIVEVAKYVRVNIDEVYAKLKKKLSAGESYRFVFTDKGTAIYAGLHDVVKANLEYVMKCAKRMFVAEIESYERKLTVIEIIEDMKKRLKDKGDNSGFKSLVDMSNQQAVKYIKDTYKVDDDCCRAVLSKSLSYLTKEHDSELEEIKNKLQELRDNDNDIYGYLFKVYKALLKEVTKIFEGRKTTKFEVRK